MYSLIQSLPTLLLLASCLPTIVKCQHHRQLRHAPSNDNRQSNDYIDPIIIDEHLSQPFNTPTLSPSSFHIPVGEDTLPPTYAFTTTTTSYHNDDAPYPPLPLPISAFQSKMTPSLVQLHSTESSLQATAIVPTSQPSSSDTIDGAPSKLSLSSTITSSTLNTSSTNKLFQQNEQLSFTTSLHSTSNTDDDDTSASTEVVHCNSSSSSSAAEDTSIEPYYIIELPYYYQIETTQRRSTVIQIAIVEQSILSAMADHILTCDEHNDKEEDIRYRALSNEQWKSRVVAVSSDQSNKRECKYHLEYI